MPDEPIARSTQPVYRGDLIDEQRREDGSVEVTGLGEVGQAIADATPGSGSGESSPLRVYGPFEVDYTDFPAANSVLNLFTPAVGDVILSWWGDPDTFETGDGDILMGQGTAWAANAATRTTDFGNDDGFGVLGQPWHGGDVTALDAEINLPQSIYGKRYGEAGVKHLSTLAVVTAATPVQVANVSGQAMATGHVDLYFLVATPELP